LNWSSSGAAERRKAEAEAELAGVEEKAARVLGDAA
jgi:hypothetical protein